MLYYIILCYIILYYVMLYYIYYIILCYMIWYDIILQLWHHGGLTAMFCKSSCGTTISKERCWDENRAAERSGGLAPQAILWEITPLSFKIRWENTIVGRSTMYIPLVILRLQHTYWMILWSWTCFRLSNPLVDYKQTLHIFCSPPQLSSISSHQICQGYWAQEKGKDANDWHQPVLPRSQT